MTQFSTPEELEKTHVRDAYDLIAPRFTRLRHRPWPKVTAFLQSLPAGSVIADVGCGTGKYLGLASHSFITGSDTCEQFIRTAREGWHEVSISDNQLLPYRDNCFDAVISVGVVHHFASVKRRMGALCELARILRPGGKLLVYAWALEQSERKFSGQDVLVPYKGHQKSKGTRVKHICHFAGAANGGKATEQNGARDKCLCSVISHESLFEHDERNKQSPRKRYTPDPQESNGNSNGRVVSYGPDKTERNGRDGHVPRNGRLREHHSPRDRQPRDNHALPNGCPRDEHALPNGRPRDEHALHNENPHSSDALHGSNALEGHAHCNGHPRACHVFRDECPRDAHAFFNGHTTDGDDRFVRNSDSQGTYRNGRLRDGDALLVDNPRGFHDEQLHTGVALDKDGVACNGHAREDPTPTNTNSGDTSGTSKLSAFVAHVTSKLFDRQEPRLQNASEVTFAAELHQKFRRLIPSPPDGDRLRNTTLLKFLSGRLFKRDENNSCIVGHNGIREAVTCSTDPNIPLCTGGTVSAPPRVRQAYGVYCNGRDQSLSNERSDESFTPKERSFSDGVANGIGSRLLARLLENISSSDSDSDSSSSGYCAPADWKLLDENSRPRPRSVDSLRNGFDHTTLRCSDFDVTSGSSTDEEPPSAAGLRDADGRCQRYYHVFRQGELVELIEEGAPSLRVLEEYYDHANWAVISIKN